MRGDKLTDELKVVWNIHGPGEPNESVADLDEAVELVRRRERFEGRPLEEEEYDLIVLREVDGKKAIGRWRDASGCGVHGHVEVSRLPDPRPWT